VTYNGRVQRTVRALSSLGDVVLVTSGGSRKDQTLFERGVEVRPTIRPEPRGPRKFVRLHRQNDQLADTGLAAGYEFDLVWANDYSTLHPGLRIAREHGAKLVYDSHEIWLETVNQFFPSDAHFPRSLAFKWAVTASRALGNLEEPRLVKHADLVITANESYAAVLRERFAREDVAVVLNCPELTDLQVSDRIRNELALRKGERIVLYQGMMNPGRGLGDLVESARHFPESTRLVMLGGGPIEPALRNQVRESGLDERVLFAGVVPQADLHEWTASADLGVLMLTPINESKRLSLANKVFEYMAAALPVLTTDLPENRRIIERCDCGWLVPDSNPEALAGKIARILADPDEMRRRGENGRKWFEERYNWSVESRHLIAALSDLLPRTEGAIP
jgi:glycosyltransferase involved in cell wall biosynthesis